MPSAPHPPPQPNPGDLIGEQNTANQQQAATQQGANMVNQNDPYGSLGYTMSIDPQTGQPRYTATQTQTGPQQALLGTSQGTGIEQGLTGLGLAGSMLGGGYTNLPNLEGNANSLTSQFQQGIAPIFEQFAIPQQQQLDTQLRNSGIMPGTPAYNQQMNQMLMTQGNTINSQIAQFQPSAFMEALQSYNAPEQMLANMFGMMQPANLASTFTNTPQVNMNAANANQANAVSLGQGNFDYNQAVQRQNNMMSGIFNSIPAMSSMGGGMMSMLGGLFA